MKNTECHRVKYVPLQFIFSLGKWTLFYAVKGLQRSLNTRFRI